MSLKLAELYEQHKEELTRQVTTEQGLTMTVRFINDKEYESLVRQRDNIRNPEARRQAARASLIKLVGSGVQAWDMTPAVMAKYLDMDVSALPESIPSEPAVVRDLLGLSDVFFGQVQAEVTDLAAFRVAQETEERKN